MLKHFSIRALSLLCVLLAMFSCACAEPEIILPDEYILSGTLPVYCAVERDFTQLVDPAFINQSGAMETFSGKHHYTAITFHDEAQLEWDKNSLYYQTYDGTCEITHELERGEKVVSTYPQPDMRNAASTLASWMVYGWPVTHEVYALESAALTHITLDEAKNRVEQLFAHLKLEDYVCENAIDMSLKRIQEMGAKWNQLIQDGHMFNNPILDYSAATTQDEGYFLIYNRFGPDGDNAGQFRASFYVAANGFGYFNIHDQYAVGEVCETPEKLVSWQTVMASLPKELKASRMALELETVSHIRLTWNLVRNKETASGLAFTPVWVINFNCKSDEENFDHLYATFSAVDGRLIDGNWI